MRRSRFFISILAAVILAALSAGDAWAEPLAPSGPSSIKPEPWMEMLADPGRALTFEEVSTAPHAADFKKSHKTGWTNGAVWYRLSVKNPADADARYYLQIMHPWVTQAEFFAPDGQGGFKRWIAGDGVPHRSWDLDNPVPTFPVVVPAGGEATIHIRALSEDLFELPFVLHTEASFQKATVWTSAFMALFVGATVTMLFYNLLLYLSLRDKAYLHYVFYITCMGILVLSLKGCAFAYLWPDSPVWANRTNHLFGSLVQITGILFTRLFLRTTETMPRLDRVMKGYAWLHAAYLPFIYLIPASYFAPASAFTEASPLIFDVLLLVVGIEAWREGYRAARYYVVSMAFTVFGMAVFIMGVLGAFPYGFFADNIMEVGFLIEIVLLSLALADRINMMQDEKAEAQGRALEQERLLKETLSNANVELERKVGERTHELRQSQQKLIHSEKMAALGQLIAGIAHEINTPLGAIRASVGNITSSLNNTFDRLAHLLRSLGPEELEHLLLIVHKSGKGGMNLSAREERAHRRVHTETLEAAGVGDAESVADLLVDMEIIGDIADLVPVLKTENGGKILQAAFDLVALQKNSHNIGTAVEKASKVVFALKRFVHHDHLGRMTVSSVVEGIETVLTLYHHHIKHGIEVVRKYDAKPEIPCYPDELNQVWTNILHNALHAMNQKGRLEIEVAQNNGHARIAITDSGHGIPPAIAEKIFDPFFTTKPEGEGSGLGLDIVKKIVDRHGGAISVESVPGRTTFTVLLMLEQKVEGERSEESHIVR